MTFFYSFNAEEPCDRAPYMYIEETMALISLEKQENVMDQLMFCVALLCMAAAWVKPVFFLGLDLRVQIILGFVDFCYRMSDQWLTSVRCLTCS